MDHALNFTLQSKYSTEEGAILLTGLQALVRLPLDQHRADRRRGLHTATFVSGYRGSPLGGLDLELQRTQELLQAHHVVFQPGVNEDLGATAVFGSQLANRLPHPKYDGVLGMWYGKAPGVDRSGDVFKHANFTGVDRHGGVLAIAGDDPAAKSSTLPSQSEAALYDAQIPVLYPGTVQEVLDMGRLGFELSRYSGCWVGLKIVTNVADGFGTAEVSPARIPITDPGFSINGQPWQHTQNPALLAPHSIALEQELYEGRLEAAKLFAAVHDLNRITVPTADAWLGIAAAGQTYYDLREALRQLGLDDAALNRHGIRLLKVGMLYPLEPSIVRQFARGLDEILVIEEKRAFIELFLRDVLYNLRDRPRVVGKRDENNRRLTPHHDVLDADAIAALLADRLRERVPAGVLNESALAHSHSPPTIELTPHGQPATARTPYFCSGCPHNRSTAAPADALVGGGIGCHTMTLLMDDRPTTGITHMGGEGAQWVGAAPFTETRHIFQNLGDGTLFHSGSLAIRQAVAANVNITYKILHNNAVAMTGGQHADGAMPLPALTRALQAEGVHRTIVVSADPAQYGSDAEWARGVLVWPRARLDEAHQALRRTPGVSVLIYDQECAAELRRQRRRGQAPEPSTRVFINEAVCEGCGDCGEKSNCLSVFPVETEFGRKTQIHQSSCNKDYTCLEGDCPAFITVTPTAQQTLRHPAVHELAGTEWDLPDPVRKAPETCNLYLMGVGGTGVVTVNQLLGTAAFLDGKSVQGLDQTGLSQKGGPVVSSLKLCATAESGCDASHKVAAGAADVYLACDVLTATTADNLRRAHPQRTVAVVSTSRIPTGAMVKSTAVHYPGADWLRRPIDARTRAAENVYLDTVALAEHFFDSHMPANIIAVGAAYQAGLLPISSAAIERAITLNGVAVETNIQAFRVGRRAAADPDWAESLEIERPGALRIQPTLTPQTRAIIDEVGASGEVARLLRIRVPELIAYQDVTYARQYVDFVKRVVEVEQRVVPGETQLSQAVARYLFKLMAYKDEYEVARLHLKPELTQALANQFGAGAPIRYRLHPPILRALGWQRKIEIGRWFEPLLRLLVWLRRLRGTPFDLFGYTRVRRTERALIDEYRSLMAEALADLTPETHAHAVKLAELPDRIRGYEDIKLQNVERFWTEVRAIRAEWRAVESGGTEPQMNADERV